MQRSRSYRRAEKERHYKRAVKYIKETWFLSPRSEETVQERAERWAHIHGDTGKTCSRSCCKNPRRSGWQKGNHKRTYQERKQLEDEGL